MSSFLSQCGSVARKVMFSIKCPALIALGVGDYTALYTPTAFITAGGFLISFRTQRMAMDEHGHVQNGRHPYIN